MGQYLEKTQNYRLTKFKKTLSIGVLLILHTDCTGTNICNTYQEYLEKCPVVPIIFWGICLFALTALRYNVTCYTKRSDLIWQDTKFERECKLSACMNIE